MSCHFCRLTKCQAAMTQCQAFVVTNWYPQGLKYANFSVKTLICHCKVLVMRYVQRRPDKMAVPSVPKMPKMPSKPKNFAPNLFFEVQKWVYHKVNERYPYTTAWPIGTYEAPHVKKLLPAGRKWSHPKIFFYYTKKDAPEWQILADHMLDTLVRHIENRLVVV